MAAFFNAISPTALTWSGLALLVVLAIMFGWVVPRSTHLRMLRIQAEAHEVALRVQAEAHAAVVEVLTTRNVEVVTEKNEHRDGAKVWQEAAQELMSQNRTMLEQNTTVLHAIEGIRSGLVERATRE